MTTPWGVEFNKNILLIIHHYLAIVVGHDDMDGAILLLGKGFGLDAGLNFAVNKVLNKRANVLLGDLFGLVKGEFLVLDGLLNRESGPFVNLEVQITGVGTKSFGIDGREINNAFVLLSKGFESVCKLLALLWSLGEDIGKRDTGLHIPSVGLRSNFTNKWDAGLLGKVLNSRSVELLRERVLALIKVFV